MILIQEEEEELFKKNAHSLNCFQIMYSLQCSIDIYIGINNYDNNYVDDDYDDDDEALME